MEMPRRHFIRLCAGSLGMGMLGSVFSVLAAPRFTGFTPQMHGFRFANTFENDFVREFNVRTGGLCGGMVYTALDYYLKRSRITTQDYRPAVQTPLHDYIYNRQVKSIADNVDKWAEFTEAAGNIFGARNSEQFKWGLQGYGGGRLQELMEKIDRGTPVPLGLKDEGGMGDHQVLAIGYDLGRYRGDLKGFESDLRIFVYDPNHPGVTMALMPDVAREVYIYQGSRDYSWRAYFVDKKYSPQTPPVVTAAASPATDGKVRELLLEIGTGGDDLRGGSDNLNVLIHARNRPPQNVPNINRGRRWIDNYVQTVSILLSEPVDPCDLTSLVLSTTFGGGIGGDNWNMNSLKVTAVGGRVNKLLYDGSGTPLYRFTGNRKTFSAALRC